MRNRYVCLTCIWLMVGTLLAAVPAGAQTGTAESGVSGRVTDEYGSPVGFANVFLADHDYAGDVTNDSGRFDIRTSVRGKRILIVSFIGFQTFEGTITVPDTAVDIVLEVQPLELSEVRIEASSYTAGEGSVTLQRLDVYTTPGAAADVFQSVKVLPGVIQADETAAIPVRGGHPSESLILFNGATLAHPVHFEGIGRGGLFSVIETEMMKDLYFSSGGFSVRYGNALSGVLEIETQDRILQNRTTVGANLVGLSGSTQRVLVDDRLSLHVLGKATTTDLLFRINDPPVEVIEDPRTLNVSGMMNYTYSPAGSLQLLVLTSKDRQGFNITLQSNANRYRLESAHRLANLRWRDNPRKGWLAGGSFTISQYSNDWVFGTWFRDNRELDFKGKTDHTVEISPRFILASGAEFRSTRYDLDFRVPKRNFEFFDGAEALVTSGTDRVNSAGGYAELTSRVNRQWSASTGIRMDANSVLASLTMDVRAAAACEMSKTTFIRLAAGTFHQTPDYLLYSAKTGNPDLKPMRAVHLIAGIEWTDRQSQFKAEIYRKEYDNLPLEDSEERYTSDGKGWAHGLDLFWKTAISDLSGWISYSFIRSERKELDIPELTRSEYDITHNLTLVAKQKIPWSLELATTMRYATGRPFTPIESGVFDAEAGLWNPVYGSKNSARLPTFKRIDVRLSHFLFFENGLLVSYVEALNLFGFDNLLSYSYSADFSERDPIESYFANPTIVVGFSLTF